jgi:hypothetical protein
LSPVGNRELSGLQDHQESDFWNRAPSGRSTRSNRGQASSSSSSLTTPVFRPYPQNPERLDIVSQSRSSRRVSSARGSRLSITTSSPQTDIPEDTPSPSSTHRTNDYQTPPVSPGDTTDFELESIATETERPRSEMAEGAPVEFTISDEAWAEIKSDKIPRPQKHGPTFDKDQPRNLNKFLKSMESIFRRGNVTTGDGKIGLALEFMDPDTADIHMEDAANSNKDWDKFVQALRETYPESVDDTRGSLRRLEDIVAQNKIIVLGQEERLRRYNKEFSIELKRLMNPPPGMLSNQQAVKLYLECFDSDFLNAMSVHLPAVTGTRRREDPWDIKDVMDAALTTSKGHIAALVGLGLKANPRQDSSSTPELWKGRNASPVVKKEPQDELWAKMTASTTINEIKMKEVMQKVDQQTELLNHITKMVMNQNSGSSVGNNRTFASASTSRPNMSNNVGRGMFKCFFCGNPEHAFDQCPIKQEYVEKGWITVEGTVVRLQDGTWVPRDTGDGETRAEKVVRLLKEKGLDKPKSKASMLLSPFTSSVEEEEKEKEDSQSTMTGLLSQMSNMLMQMNNRAEVMEQKIEEMECHRKDDLASIHAQLNAYQSGN